MSTVSSYDSALDFYPSSSAKGSKSSFGGRLAAKLSAFWAALAEGNAAAYRYRELVARGLTADEAATKVFSEFYSVR